MPGNAVYYIDNNNKEKCPENIRFAGKGKFPKKFLYQFISESNF